MRFQAADRHWQVQADPVAGLPVTPDFDIRTGYG
jgi:hypothetical protein